MHNPIKFSSFQLLTEQLPTEQLNNFQLNNCQLPTEQLSTANSHKRHFFFIATIDDFFELYINEGVLFSVAAAEQDGNVVFSVASRHAFAVNALNEHALRSSLHHFEVLDLVFQRNLPHHFAAFGFHFFRHLVGHRGRLGAGAY